MTFHDWKLSNRHIVSWIFDLADDMRARGHAHWSIRAAMHVLRWQTAMREEPDRGWKINNAWSKPMAELYNASCGYQFFRTRDSD